MNSEGTTRETVILNIKCQYAWTLIEMEKQPVASSLELQFRRSTIITSNTLLGKTIGVFYVSLSVIKLEWKSSNSRSNIGLLSNSYQI